MEPTNGNTTSDTLLVLQPKSFRSFSTKDEYLYAMKEDLADWFMCLYKIEINGDIFFEVIETGILLCQHANEVINFTKERREKGIEIVMKSYFVRKIPEELIQYKENVKPGSFLARDNISNFISWCRLLGIPDDLRFETEDLVTRKNEKSVILCLLEVARVGAKLGMLAPTIVKMEEEIDAELAGEPPAQIITCDLKSLDEMVRHLVGFCTCPMQFPMVKVGDGKYQVGESRTLIFVRILRKHVMVRVGGGWDTLERYLDKHDPCRCHYPGHRGTGGPNVSSGANTGGQKNPPRRMSTPNPTSAQQNIPSQRRMSSTNTAPATPSKITPNSRSKSPSPSSCRLPTSKLSTIPQHSQTSQNGQSPMSRRSHSPGPTPSRSHSPGPGVNSPSRIARTLPKTPGQRGIPTARRPSGTLSPAPNKQQSLSVRLNQANASRALTRQKSLDTTESDDMETENGEKISMEEIKTMTLEDFKNLLNSALSVPGTGGSSQCSDSPRSQESADNSYRNQTKSFVRHGKDSEKGPSWRSVREKARNVCDSSSALQYQRNVNNNRDTSNPQNSNSRPKTPTSNLRPKTPTSGYKSVYAQRPTTPNSRARTTSSSTDYNNSMSSRESPARSTLSSEEDLSQRGYVRSRAPSKASSFSSLDDEDAAEVARINGCGISRSSKESSPSESVDGHQPMKSRTPGLSGIPRANTPSSGIPRCTTPASSSKPSTPRMARKSSLPDGSQRRVSLTPSDKSEKTYTGMYQARRSKTPGPHSERTQIPGGNRSITPGPRESWQKPAGNNSTNGPEGDRRNRSVSASRSLNFTRQRSRSVVDVRDDDGEALKVKKNETTDFSPDDPRARMRSKILALAEKRQRSMSSGPKGVDSKGTVVMVTRGKGGSHSVTVEDSGVPEYKTTSTPGTPKAGRAQLQTANGNTDRFRARSKTPDPRMYSVRTRSTEPRSIMMRRNSGGPAAQSASKRLEAWVDSTVNENKHKLPPRPKRSMTPNSLEFTEKDLEPRPFEEIKAALVSPINGITPTVEHLPPPPEDPEMFMKMEKLFAKYREMELQASDGTQGLGDLNVDVIEDGDVLTNDSTSILSSKSNTSPSGPSNNWSWTNSGSSRSSGSPGPNGAMSKNAAAAAVTSTPISDGPQPKVGMDDLNSSAALVSKMKEVLKVRPRNEPKSGPRTRIPAPAMSKTQRSRSITNLNVSSDCSVSVGSRTDTDSAYDQSTAELSEDTDETSEISQITAKCNNDSGMEANRSHTPIPKLAAPLVTGRSTVISNTNSTTRLVRAMSQEPADHSRSNSLSSLSSRLSVSNADDDMDYV